MVRTDSLWALVGRALWIMLGPIALSATACVIISSPGTGWQTRADLFYFAALGGMVAGRWIEFASGAARDSFGKVATKADVWRYTCGIVAGGLLLWLLVNVIANYVLG